MMMPYTAHVRNGRLILDEPTTLPDGAEVELETVEDLDDEDRGQLHDALLESEEDVAAGRLYPAHEVLARLGM